MVSKYSEVAKLMGAVALQYALRGVRKLEAERGSCCISYTCIDNRTLRELETIWETGTLNSNEGNVSCDRSVGDLLHRYRY